LTILPPVVNAVAGVLRGSERSGMAFHAADRMRWACGEKF
jgi:hypothetical protein